MLCWQHRTYMREQDLGWDYRVHCHCPMLKNPISYFRNWTLADLCFKPPPPEMRTSSVASNYRFIIRKIIPCIWITPIDCFWEGSKAVGPHPSIESKWAFACIRESFLNFWIFGYILTFSVCNLQNLSHLLSHKSLSLAAVILHRCAWTFIFQHWALCKSEFILAIGHLAW